MFLILVCIAVLVWYSVFRYKRRRIYQLTKNIPSLMTFNKIYGYLPFTLDGAKLAFPMVMDFVDFAYKNGGAAKFWVGPMFYIGTIRAKDVEYILKKFVDKESLETLIRDVMGNGSIFGPVDVWTRRRKLLVPAFSPKTINNFFDIMVDRSDELVEQFNVEERIGVGKFSVWPYVSAYTLSLIAETSLGTKLDVQKNPNMPIQLTINYIFTLITKRLFSVWLWPQWIYRYTSTYRQTEKCKNTINDLTGKIIQERRETLKHFMKNKSKSNSGQGPGHTVSVLDLLLQSGDSVTDIELREEMFVLLLAGSDGLAVAISCTLVLLAKYPEVQEKVYAEIADIFKGSDRRIEKSDLNDVQYLQRVIKESLRLFAPVPILGRKIDKETALPSGMILPKGSEVLIPVWGVHRDPNTWGPTADCFDPDRFLSEDKCGLFIPFSMGPRNCLGYKYGLIAMKIALITILRKYRVVGEAEDGPKPKMECIFTIVLRDKDNYQISLKER